MTIKSLLRYVNFNNDDKNEENHSKEDMQLIE